VSAFALKPLNRGTEYCFFLNHQQHEAVAFDLKIVAFSFSWAFLIFAESLLFRFLLNHRCNSSFPGNLFPRCCSVD